jgi:hypothetical protein
VANYGRGFSLPHFGPRRSAALAVLCLALGVALVLAPCAFAGLGQDVSSVLADQAHVQGSLRTTQMQNYSVHEIHSANSTVLREYVSTAGKVFGVAWQGPWLPDMRQLLAGYFDQFAQGQAQASSHRGRRLLEIDQPNLVVQSAGRPRAFAGRAYDPQLLPPGVTPEQIR